MKKFTLKLKGTPYRNHIRATILYNSSMVPERKQKQILQKTEGSIVEAICVVSVVEHKERKRVKNLMLMLGLNEI